MVEREDLIDAMVNRDIDVMNMNDLVGFDLDEFVTSKLEDLYHSYSDKELRKYAAENYPEVLEALDKLSEGV